MHELKGGGSSRRRLKEGEMSRGGALPVAVADIGL